MLCHNTNHYGKQLIFKLRWISVFCEIDPWLLYSYLRMTLIGNDSYLGTCRVNWPAWCPLHSVVSVVRSQSPAWQPTQSLASVSRYPTKSREKMCFSRSAWCWQSRRADPVSPLPPGEACWSCILVLTSQKDNKMKMLK